MLGLNLQQRQDEILLEYIFPKWNETAAWTEKDIVSNKLVELEVICG